MREPIIKNKYNLTMDKIKRLKVADRSQIQPPLFWRNNVVQAWCIVGNAGTSFDRRFCMDNSFWIGIYDEDAPNYTGKCRVYFTSYGGMCNYIFNRFYCSEDIERENDLLIQEMCLEKINLLIDLGILKIE